MEEKNTFLEEEEQEPSTKSVDAAHYVDNKKFLAALVEYRKEVDLANSKKEELPLVPNYIAECFVKIATHLSYKSNFINYTFRDDMISDGIENCLIAARKFDPSISSNPFAYYTQITYYAFIRRIQKEKKHQATKYKLIENLDLDSIIQENDDSDSSRQLIEYLKKQLDIIDPEKRETPEQTKAKKKKAKAETETGIDLLD